MEFPDISRHTTHTTAGNFTTSLMRGSSLPVLGEFSVDRRFLKNQGIEAVIPLRANRKKLLSYDKLAKTFMAFAHLVCAFVAFQPSAANSA